MTFRLHSNERSCYEGRSVVVVVGGRSGDGAHCCWMEGAHSDNDLRPHLYTFTNSSGFIWVSVTGNVGTFSSSTLLRTPPPFHLPIERSRQRGETVDLNLKQKENTWIRGGVAVFYKQQREAGDKAQQVILRRDRPVSLHQQNWLIRNSSAFIWAAVDNLGEVSTLTERQRVSSKLWHRFGELSVPAHMETVLVLLFQVNYLLIQSYFSFVVTTCMQKAKEGCHQVKVRKSSIKSSPTESVIYYLKSRSSREKIVSRILCLILLL